MTSSWRPDWLATALVAVVGCGVAYGLLVGKPGPEPQPVPEQETPVVDVLAVQPRQRTLTVTTQGTVTPLREISLVSRVAGRVVSVTGDFAQGGFVRAGEQLVQVEDVDYGFAISRAESQVAAARQRVAEEQGRVLQARREWRDLGSEQANDLFLRKPQLAAAEAALKAAEADLGAARLDFERTRILSPFNGRISAKHVDQGQFITAGTVVAQLYATDAVQVRLPLTDRQVALLDLPLHYVDAEQHTPAGAAVTLEARFGSRDWQWQGAIVRTDASIDVNSRVVYAVVEVEQPFAREPGSDRPPLAPGLFVNAVITGRALSAVTILPRTALRSDGAVMLVDAQQRVQPRPVQLLQSNASQVWIQGLQRGDRVVVHESAAAVAGMQVNAHEVEQVAGAEY